MRRSILLTALLAMVILATASLAVAQDIIEYEISFQGRLTDNAGIPVADGPHSFAFRIFNVPAGGSALWTEGPISISTAGGLFNHQLGSLTVLPQTLFQDHDALYLEIVVDGETQAPRTSLVSTPFTRVAGGLKVRRTTNDTVVIRTIPDAHQLSTYGSDGKEQIRLWGPSYGEIMLHEGDLTNDVTARLAANNSSGGELELRDNNGSTVIDLYGGLPGDASVFFPNNAINALEIKDEPGVASDIEGLNVLGLDGSYQTLLSRSITTPADGFVLAIGTVGMYMLHFSGTENKWAEFGVSDAAGSLPANQEMEVAFPLSAPSGLYKQTVTVHGLFSVAAGLSTFYLVGHKREGDFAIYDRQLSLIYFPTSYGTVEPTIVEAKPDRPAEQAPKVSVLTAANLAAEQAEAKTFNAERIARELTQVRSEMEVLKREMREQRNQNQQGIENEN
ncbi:MAG: hypothetical protein L0196_01450 [candidate division Zixibacteria bacterium]|nr:hypothetical protein [candidate division Zixibacteria bacterium]